VDSVAFGDLHLADVRAYREDLMASSGMTALFPIWGRPTGALAREMIDLGIRAVLTCVDPAQLPAEFAGRSFDLDLLADLPEGVDPCGENGEFHTFAWDGPGFSAPIPVEVGAIVERDGLVFCDLIPTTTRGRTGRARQEP
jgi:diphthamide synthase (EF-2-diphthine--ammonia ligase)